MHPAYIFLIGILQALLILFAAPLYSGFSRVMRAKMHSRHGPVLLQNYRDLFKLMKRQEVVSYQAGWVFLATPYILMAAMLLVSMIVPIIIQQSPLGSVGDLIVVVYLFILARFFFSLSGLDSGSSFAGIGSRREMFLSVLTEPIILLVVLVMALLSGSTNLGTISSDVSSGGVPYYGAVWLGLIAFAVAAFVEMGKLPYDLAEAEQELQEGPLSEYSGSSLAILKWALYTKQLVLVALFLSIFIPFGSMAQFSLGGLALSIAAFLLKALGFYFLVALLENGMARVRFVKAPVVIWVAFGAALLSFVFYLIEI